MSFDLAFVDSIATSPTVRLDLNAADGTGFKCMLEGTDFGMPSLRRATSGTLLADGEHVSASAYGNRVLTLQLDLSHLGKDAAAAKVQLLARELNRSANFLRYKADTSDEVTFLTLRSPISRSVWDQVDMAFTVQVLAQPFALGAKASLTLVTVTNNPAAATNGSYIDITGIKGDVETPAQVLLKGLDGGSTFHADLIIGTRRRGTPSSAVFFLQCESMATHSDTSLPGNDAAMSGAGSNYARTTFTTPAMTLRLTASPFPAAAGVDLRGTYRMYAMLRGNNASTFEIRWDLEAGSATYSSPTFTHVPLSSTNRTLVDLGQVTMPLGADPVYDGYSGTEKSIVGAILRLNAGRTAGAGNLDWDYLALVPDDPERGDDWMSMRLSLTQDCVIDGPNDMIHPQTVAATTLPSAPTISRSGRVPMLSPGVNQRWIMLRPDRAGVDAVYGDRIGATFDATISYWPRYLLVRPSGG